jgi:hypothetical protein
LLAEREQATRPRGPWALLARIDVIGPVLVVAALFAIVVGGRLHTYHGNATGFVLFGQKLTRYTHPPHGAVINSPYGYDGQFFYLQAKDPLLRHDATVASFQRVGQAFRLQRVAYPMAAYVLAAGQVSALPWSLLAINLLVVLGATGGFAVYARRQGWSGWWALAVGLLAGFLAATLRDLSDPLAVSSMLAGLVAWQRGRRWWAAALLSVAVLAREPMTLAVLAIAVDAAVDWWRTRRAPGALRRAARHAWPAVVIPAAAFLAWQVYVDARYGGNAAATGHAFGSPFRGLLDEVSHAANDASRRNTAWDLTYLGLMAAGTLAALALVWREVTAASVAAALFGVSLMILIYGDPWSYTRISAPMFAALLLAGLVHRNRPALAVCAAATAMTVVLPFAPWLVAA